MKRLSVLLSVCITLAMVGVVVGQSYCPPDPPIPTPYPPQPTYTPGPTYTPNPTYTPRSTHTSTATNTITPISTATATCRPTHTPVPAEPPPTPYPTATDYPTSTPYPITPTVTITPTLTATPTQTPVTGETFYVAPDGNDANPGTIDQPWQTISRAAGVELGSTVYFREGTYYGGLGLMEPGVPGQWTVFASYPGENAKIISTRDAVAIRCRYGQAQILTYDEMPSYYEIRDLDLQGAIKGIRIDQAHHIRLTGNIVHDSDVGGIVTANGVDHLLIESNVIHDNSNGGSPCSSGISIWNAGCFFGESSTCNVLNDGIEGYHIVIRGNVIYANRNDDSGCPISDGNGVIMDNNGDDTPLSLIANNLIYHNGGRCIQCLNSDNVHVYHNTCWENLQTPKMQNNGAGEILLYEHEIAGATMTFDNVIIKNNVIYGRGDGCPWQAWGLSESGYESDYNLWYQDDVDGNYFQDYSNILGRDRTCSWNHGPNEKLGNDPLFVSTSDCVGGDPYYDCDWESTDFRLMVGSPAIDTGDELEVVTEDFDGITRPQGAAYDIGAYEHR